MSITSFLLYVVAWHWTEIEAGLYVNGNVTMIHGHVYGQMVLYLWCAGSVMSSGVRISTLIRRYLTQFRGLITWRWICQLSNGFWNTDSGNRYNRYKWIDGKRSMNSQWYLLYDNRSTIESIRSMYKSIDQYYTFRETAFWRTKPNKSTPYALLPVYYYYLT